jgi:predicted nucleotidyltransferase
MNRDLTYDMNEIEANDINLKSFEPKDKLNPYLWHNNKIDSDVRIMLLDIAKDFIDTLSVKWVKPKDIILYGSLANYNWSKYSDIDLHVVIDFKEVYDKVEFVEDYFDSKKDLWNQTHENLKIYGYPVEMYVEDVNADPQSSGAYSLITNEWLKEPAHLSDAKLDKTYVREMSAKFINKVDEIEDKIYNEKNEKNLEILSDKLYRLFEELKDIRTKGLESEAQEMSNGNIIWKVMRRTGYIERIWNIIDSTYDKINSIN